MIIKILDLRTIQWQATTKQARLQANVTVRQFLAGAHALSLPIINEGSILDIT